MRILITDPIFQTQIFIVAFLIALLFSARIRKPLQFDNLLTEELKGFAMLAIVFSHIGYFLVSDDRFLFPLSIAAGIGVNLFLFLSGYGLTISSIKNPLSLKDFYKKRLIRLFIPLWIILIAFLSLDFLLLHKAYPLDYLTQSFLGIFLTSNPSLDIDSPLWYFSLIFFFYLIFPLAFRFKKPIWSGILILASSYILLQIPLPLKADNIALYKLHFLAFPLGIILASLTPQLKELKFKIMNYLRWVPKILIRLSLLIILGLLFTYFAIHSGVGEDPAKEQAISIISTFLILAIFLLKSLQFKFLNLVGKYSYEIYLLHWPILFRFDHLYHFLPGSVATVFYIIEFLLLAFVLQRLTNKILQLKFLKTVFS